MVSTSCIRLHLRIIGKPLTVRKSGTGYARITAQAQVWMKLTILRIGRQDGAFMRRFWFSGNKADAMAAGANRSIYGQTGPSMLTAKDWLAGIFCLRWPQVQYWLG
ncbi:hypothetical protein D3C80_1941620 [compost metagenome]